MATTINTVITSFVNNGIKEFKADIEAFEAGTDSAEGKAKQWARINERLLGSGANQANNLQKLGQAAYEAGSSLEKVQAGLTLKLGSTDAATAKVKELQNFAAKSPLDFQQSGTAAQQLLNMGFAANDIIPTMEAVGNAVAIAGGGDEAFAKVIVSLGELRSKSQITAADLAKIAANGIPVFSILQAKLGISREQLEALGAAGISAAQAIPALTAGMRDLGGGTGLETLADTLPGKMETMTDSVERLNAAVYKLFSNDAKSLIDMLTTLSEKVQAFVENNPTLAKGMLVTAGVGAGVAVAVGAVGKAAGAYNDIVSAVENARKGKKDLTSATKADTAAEAAKALVAGQESSALDGVAEAAAEAAASKETLAKETAKPAKLSPWGRFTEFLRKPIGLKTIPSASSATPWSMSNLASAQGLWGTSGPMALQAPTVGSAALGGALGVAAGVGVRSDLKYLGYSDAQANTAAMATGLGAAALVAFNPAAAALVGGAEAIRLGVNYFYSDRKEAEAVAGNGIDAAPDLQAKLTAAATPGQKAAVYMEQRDRLLAQGDEVGAENARLTALSLTRQQRRRDKPNSRESMAEQERKFKEWTTQLDKEPREPDIVRLSRAQEMERLWLTAQANGDVKPGEDKGHWFLRKKKAESSLPPEARALGRVERVGQRIRIRFQDLDINDPSMGQYNNQVAAGYG